MEQMVNKATKYCLYARKSTEEDERQALSIDSQIKEMTLLAERDDLNIVEIRRESHSAKESGKREVFNSLVRDINSGIFDGIITWNTDRISRNAGDLGLIVDLVDKHLLKEIRTYNQVFTNTPNDKFMLMILGGQAKLENDNKSINVKRGLKAKVGMGLWIGQAPVGYLNEKNVDKKGYVNIDPYRGPIIKEIFRKIAYENYSGRKIYEWLKNTNYKSINGKMISLGNIFRIIKNTFYYGMFEYPVGSGNWYKGQHEPLITKETFDIVQEKVANNNCYVYGQKQLVYSRLFKCGYCDSSMVGEEKWKTQKSGTRSHYIYYGCSRAHDRFCKNVYIREDVLTEKLMQIMKNIKLNDLELTYNLKDQVGKYENFRRSVLGLSKDKKPNTSLDIKNYAKYILKEGTSDQKRELLGCIKSKITIKDKELIVD